MTKQDLKKIVSGVVIGAALAIGASVFAAWSEPTQPPPSGNPEPPLNVSNASQTKGGNLVVNGNNVFQNGLLVPFGALVVGDSSPETGAGGLKVDVDGKTGSTMFCDENGANCFRASDLCEKVASLCQ